MCQTLALQGNTVLIWTPKIAPISVGEAKDILPSIGGNKLRFY